MFSLGFVARRFNDVLYDVTKYVKLLKINELSVYESMVHV